MSEPNNQDRAGWAENAVNTFAVETYAGRTFTDTVIEQPEQGGDASTMIADLMADLLHLAHAHSWDVKQITANAIWAFEEELREEDEEGDSDLAAAAEGETCDGCGRASIDCSRDACADVIADRAD